MKVAVKVVVAPGASVVAMAVVSTMKSPAFAPSLPTARPVRLLSSLVFRIVKVVTVPLVPRAMEPKPMLPVPSASAVLTGCSTPMSGETSTLTGSEGSHALSSPVCQTSRVTVPGLVTVSTFPLSVAGPLTP